MSTDLAKARDTITRSRALRAAGKVEAVLRAELQSALRGIFPAKEDQAWINHYVEGAEALTKITHAGKDANRFIDNLIGSTTIEYEGDLRNAAKRAEGYRQVKEHAAGQIRLGVPQSQVRGVLSDTVEWHAYDVVVREGVASAQCAPADITLTEIDQLDLTDDSEESAERLIQFIRKHLAREQSRSLRAEYVALDLGLESATHRRSSEALKGLVRDGRSTDSSIVLATDLWSEFVDHFGSDGTAFRIEAYVDEAYVGLLGRLLSANVLAGRPLVSDEGETKGILDGGYFRSHYQLENMVEQDYFGWLTRPGRIERLVPIAREIQRDLYAYDFGRAAEEDLFGRLMAQLASRSQRKLLGQEWTPSWLARELADRCLEGLPQGEMPRIVDMCCGSGAILAEVLKASKAKLGLSDIADLRDVATGFDIDPLAVSLAKTTWVVTLASEIKAATSPVVIPIYNADSMFAVTPVSTYLPILGDEEPISIKLDGTVVELPYELVQPDLRDLFDRVVDWAYDEARHAQAVQAVEEVTQEQARIFLNAAAKSIGTSLSKDLEDSLSVAARALAQRMSELAVANRNGIWAFILRNAYRPGLLTGQFNGLVSNPPWLAMSALADNPYRKDLTARAKVYGIRPTGQSFLHLELGTMHLLHAVDRYLKPGASVACLVPGTIMNGDHHELFRQAAFLKSKRPVAFQVDEVWQVAPGTFKYPGAAVVGHKLSRPEDVGATTIDGFLAEEAGLEPKHLSVLRIGAKRTAWSFSEGRSASTSLSASAVPQQGADLMPRTAVCVEILSQQGSEYRVDTPKAGSAWGFTIKSSKELKKDRFAGYVAPRFLYRMAQSENLLPYVLGVHCAPIAIPAERDGDGLWRIFSDTEIRRTGEVQSARRFADINKKLEGVGQGKSLQARVDERGKLSKQTFGQGGFLVLSGAGGKHICAACVPVSDAGRLVVDQTLYWQVVTNEDDAWYRVALLNSRAMTEIISPFNPKGDFAERHIHTLPYRVMPAFEPANDVHRSIAALARDIGTQAQSIVSGDAYLNDPTKSLHVRRTKLREALEGLNQQRRLDDLCASLLKGAA